MNESNNPLLCDPDSGICIVPEQGELKDVQQDAPDANSNTILIQYFTDPICSSCWGSEPQLRRLKMEYGHAIQIEYHMGGLLPSWEVYNSGAISKPSDVAGHWEEVSPHYRMPILGDVWLEDPLPSSYPPSIAFKAAELQDNKKALVFLRRLRELVFLEKRNICKWENVIVAAEYADLDTAQLRRDNDQAAQALFQSDLTLARALKVRGYPTFILSNNLGKQETVFGARSYAHFEATLQALNPDLKPALMPLTIDELFDIHDSWCAEEVAICLGLSHEKSVALLANAEQRDELSRFQTRNGSIWTRK